jgi:hypothetical protein
MMKQLIGVVAALVATIAVGIHVGWLAGDATSRNAGVASTQRRASRSEEPPVSVRESPTAVSDATREGGTGETTPEVAALREDVAQLGAEVAALQRWRRSQDRAAREVAGGKDAAKDAHSDAAARADDERRQRQMETIEADFRREVPSTDWSVQAVGVVQEALAGNQALQDTLLGIECRAQTCRAELADDGTGDLAKSMPLFLQQLAGTLPSVTANEIESGDGGKRMVLYMGRQVNTRPPDGR